MLYGNHYGKKWHEVYSRVHQDVIREISSLAQEKRYKFVVDDKVLIGGVKFVIASQFAKL